MVRNCSCGGKLMRTDVRKVYDRRSPIGYYVQDTDNLVAHWECMKCFKAYTQRKRQPAKKR